MLNQVLLKGNILSVCEQMIQIVLDNGETVVKIYNVPKEMIPSLLINNVVAINGHLEEVNHEQIIVVCDRIIVLDSRGRKNP